MHRPAARVPRRVAGALSALLALGACADDGPALVTADAGLTVVAIAAQPCDRPIPSHGVGLVVGAGLVATAAHVVDGPRRAVTVDGSPARVVAVDARTDLALVAVGRVDGAPELAEAPVGLTHVATPSGALPADIVRTGTLVVHDTTDRARYERQVHTFGPAVPEGTSGAPLVDDAGRVLGIVVLANRTDDTAYAVTSAELRALLVANRSPTAGVPVTDRVGAADPPCPE